VLLKFALEYAIDRVQTNHEGLQLSVAHQLLVYGYITNLLQVMRPKILQAMMMMMIVNLLDDSGLRK
jgi:hypothetical protein